MNNDDSWMAADDVIFLMFPANASSPVTSKEKQLFVLYSSRRRIAVRSTLVTAESVVIHFA
ncbi:hypothetical protein HDU67_006532 [Dinochytrium kinnereticum]|nr:hypothetical protein HDU67_006532 [Dinochytrium kinnereticum]